MANTDRLDRSGYILDFEETFGGRELDRRRWLPYFLPHWSTREASAARYRTGAGGLELRIDADQPPWSPDFDRWTKVSSIQTGEFCGAVGSTIGQHRFRAGLTVRQAQDNVALYTPQYGLFECRARAVRDPANMVALWMIGYEDRPQRSGEICIFEIFGRDVGPGRCRVGMGIHPWADPTLVDDFTRAPLVLDATQPHDYAAQWTPERVSFFVDGRPVKTSTQSPAYPMQFMLDIFEFADGPEPPSPSDEYPKLFGVEWFRTWRPHPSGLVDG